MRYRALSDTGDYQFGRAGIFLTNTPQAVAQAILTRFRLWTNEWFLDAQEGTPYLSDIIGHGTQGTRDIAVKERILETPGVTSILDYQSSVTADRKMTVTALVDTQYGVATVTLQA